LNSRFGAEVFLLPYIHSPEQIHELPYCLADASIAESAPGEVRSVA